MNIPHFAHQEISQFIKLSFLELVSEFTACMHFYHQFRLFIAENRHISNFHTFFS